MTDHKWLKNNPDTGQPWPKTIDVEPDPPFCPPIGQPVPDDWPRVSDIDPKVFSDGDGLA